MEIQRSHPKTPKPQNPGRLKNEVFGKINISIRVLGQEQNFNVYNRFDDKYYKGLK